MPGLRSSKSSSRPLARSAAGSMAAVVQDGYGGPGVLRLENISVPVPADKEVLVQVHAAGLARGAWYMMTGTPYLLRAVAGLRRPRQPVMGHNLAGTVTSVGAGVTRFAPGDKVYGIGRGSFAQYAAARENKLAKMPATLAFDQAAAVPVSGLTALQALDAAGVSAGMRVLVLGAAGGVGSFAVQLAAAAGADVTGACSAGKAGFVRELGAAHTLDYRSEDFAAVPGQYDAIIDIAGIPALTRLRRALRPGGTAVIVGGEGGGGISGGLIGRQLGAAVLSRFGNRRLKSLLASENGKDLERLSGLMDSGSVVPRIDSRYPLAEAAAAMDRLISGQVKGSVVLVLSPAAN